MASKSKKNIPTANRRPVTQPGHRGGVGNSLKVTLSPEQSATLLVYAVARRAALDVRLVAEVLGMPPRIHRLANLAGLDAWGCVWGLAVTLADCLMFFYSDPLGKWGWASQLKPLLQSKAMADPIQFLAQHAPRYATQSENGGWKVPLHIPREIDQPYIREFRSKFSKWDNARRSVLAIAMKANRIIPDVPNARKDDAWEK